MSKKSAIFNRFHLFILFIIFSLYNLVFSQESQLSKQSVFYANSGDHKLYTIISPDHSLKAEIDPYGGRSKSLYMNGSWNRSKKDIAIQDHMEQFKAFDFTFGTYTDLITLNERPRYQMKQNGQHSLEMSSNVQINGQHLLLKRTLCFQNCGQVVEAVSLLNPGSKNIELNFEGLAFSLASLFDFSRASSNNSNIPEFQYYYNKKLSKVSIHGAGFFGGPKTIEFIKQPRWFTVADNFFLAIIDPHLDDIVVVYNGLEFGPKYRVSTGIQILATTLLPNQEFIVSIDYYIGPRHENLVKQNINTEFIKLFKWPILFNWLLKPIELATTAIMTMLVDKTHSVGLTLILIAILVKLLLLPLSIRSAISMKKMRILQPKLNKLQEKCGHDPQLLQQKTMELYKTEKVNPLGGCLPLLLQIPVFFALFRVLSRSIELRGAGFLWIKDLTMPDSLFMIGSFSFNFLPILMTLLQICSVFLQQGRVGDSQNDMQQQMQKQGYFMPLIFLFLFWRMPSGLVLYWTIQNIFSIFEQEIINLDVRFGNRKL